VKRFEEFSGELGGVWSKGANAAYAHWFDVSLVALGSMRIGSQLNANVRVKTMEFDLVRQNLAALPRPDCGNKRPCKDGSDAKSKKPHIKHTPDGGVQHYYVSLILRCARCGANKNHDHGSGSGNQKCARCEKVYYCGRDCQRSDWLARHKNACKSLSA
jgi:hypothetical protein